MWVIGDCTFCTMQCKCAKCSACSYSRLGASCVQCVWILLTLTDKRKWHLLNVDSMAVRYGYLLICSLVVCLCMDSCRNPTISSSVMSQRMQDRRMIRIPRLVNEKLSESQLGDSWVTIGVLIKKNVKQSAKVLRSAFDLFMIVSQMNLAFALSVCPSLSLTLISWL